MPKKLFIAFIMTILLCQISYADDEKESKKILKEYRQKIHSIAILPFKDLTETDGADTEVRAAIFKGLSEINSEKTKIEIQPIEESNDKLYGIGIKTYTDIKNIPIKQLGEKLNVDAVIIGKVTTYYSPTDNDRFVNAVLGGTILGHNKGRVVAECVLRLYYCPEEKEIWYTVVSGDSKPLAFNIEAVATNMKSALGTLSENMASRWPYKNKV